MTYTCAKTLGGIETNISITVHSCLITVFVVLAFSRTAKIHTSIESKTELLYVTSEEHYSEQQNPYKLILKSHTVKLHFLQACKKRKIRSHRRKEGN